MNAPADAVKFESFKTLVINSIAANAAVKVGACNITRYNFKELIDLDTVFELVLAGAPNEEIGAEFERRFLEAANQMAELCQEEA